MKNGVASAQEDQRQFGTLKAELARLGSLIEGSKARLASYQFNAEEEARVIAALSDMTAQKADLENELRDLRTQRVIEGRSLEQITIALKDAKKKYEEYSALSSGRKDEAQRLKNDVHELTKQKADHTASRTESTRQRTAQANASIATLQQTITDLTNAIAQGTKEINGMAADRAAASALKASIATAEKRLKKITDEITRAERMTQDTHTKKAAVEAEIADERAAFEAYKKAETVTLNLREKDLEHREGELSRFTEWLKKKAGLLRDAKRELEEFRGRPLNHIVVPADEEIVI